ncbi:hypothetical protein ACI1IY_001107 [Vibrio vulnificus]|nr:hypothetical protein [Vibrio vulnificus]MBY7897380.1 hypothetical protein [Vibrio fluvialis]ARN64731.1 hypothetical protein FORC36_0214 [Vibrio vulnificus]EIO3968239.1 hypothetical protein [Vibrio vulnificus]ELE1960815.1 hypothetical protein [Vibrio vulnificus]ELL0597886.1 hypothetical protein [Vibrio vulnificus]
MNVGDSHCLFTPSGQDLNGKDGRLNPLIKKITEAALSAEMEENLAKDVQP